MNATDNTVVTAGDRNYLWGIFLLVASMRRHGMQEPVLVGAKNFAAADRAVLEQLGGVGFLPLDGFPRSLTCAKAELLLAVRGGYATWADSDAVFGGNCSELLAPPSPEFIHVRRRGAAEMPEAFPPPFDLDSILRGWREDVAAVAGSEGVPPPPSAADFRSCSACFLSVARERAEFLECWRRMMETQLPAGNVGVVDRTLSRYHQLDESCLNASLLYCSNAPKPTAEYALDKDPSRLFIHFVGPVKPWMGWTSRSVRHLRTVLDVVGWAADCGLRFPSSALPLALRREWAACWRLAAGPFGFCERVRRKLKRILAERSVR